MVHQLTAHTLMWYWIPSWYSAYSIIWPDDWNVVCCKH